MNKTEGFCSQSPANPLLKGSGEIIQDSIRKLDYRSFFHFLQWNDISHLKLCFSTTGFFFFSYKKVGRFFEQYKHLTVDSLLTKYSGRKCRENLYDMFQIHFLRWKWLQCDGELRMCIRKFSSLLSEEINKQIFWGQMPIFQDLKICTFQAKHFSLSCWVYFLKKTLNEYIDELKS